MTVSNNQTIRQAIIETLPSDTSLHGREPDKRSVYIPPSHLKALRLECSLVIGARGVGKTFWNAALNSNEIRKMLGGSVPDLSRVEVWTGFGERPKLDAYPDSDVFDALLKKDISAYDVWRAVLGRLAANIVSEPIPCNSWEESVEWVKNEPESFGRMLERANDYFGEQNKHALIVFDALDRSSAKWQTMDTIVRDLLRVVLSLKRYSCLHGKIFLREDQFAGRQIADFPDASKLLSTRVELTWALHDLHGLLWQLFCNGTDIHGQTLRNIYEDVAGSPPDFTADVWSIREIVKRDENLQRTLFAKIAGEWMGRDRRRGVPYLWSVGHLADGKGRTSPRSFLAAIRAAAEDAEARYPSHLLPLHYESIKCGVQNASGIRVSEMAEDYPWVKTLMQPLQGLTVPCTFDVIQERWCDAFGSDPKTISFTGLPPEHVDAEWSGIRRDLESLGIFESMKDGRVNLPDLYRVGFGLGRRGGVKPAKSRY
ncbi:MAG: hypothetical protein WBP54_11510 [Pelodictyon phaeoclathratiforme]